MGPLPGEESQRRRLPDVHTGGRTCPLGKGKEGRPPADPLDLRHDDPDRSFHIELHQMHFEASVVVPAARYAISMLASKCETQHTSCSH